MSSISAVPPPTAGRKRKPLLVRPSNFEGMEEEERYKPIEWPLVRRLLSVLAPYKKQYLMGLVVGLIHVSCDLTPPLFVRHIINYCTAYLTGQLTPMPTQAQAILHITFVIWCCW